MELSEKDYKFISDIKKYQSFSIYWRGFNDLNLEEIQKNLEDGLRLELRAKGLKEKNTLTLIEKINEGWKINYSEYLKQGDIMYLKDIVEEMKKF